MATAPYRVTRRLCETDAAYIAGLVDGFDVRLKDAEGQQSHVAIDFEPGHRAA